MVVVLWLMGPTASKYHVRGGTNSSTNSTSNTSLTVSRPQVSKEPDESPAVPSADVSNEADGVHGDGADDGGAEDDVLELDAGVVRAMLDAAPDASVLCDQDGHILFVNRQTELLFGYERATLLGRPVELLLPEPLRAGHRAHREHFAANPSVRPMGQDRRLAARRHDGSTFPVEIALSPFRVGSHHLALASIRDITDRLAAEAHTRYVQQLLDGTNDGVYVFAEDGLHFEYVNQGAASQTGYDQYELIHLTRYDLVLSEEGRFDAAIKPLLRGDLQMVRIEDVLQHRDGSLIPIEVSLSYPGREDGQHRVVAVARDVSERYEADTERRKAETAMALADERERVARESARHGHPGTVRGRDDLGSNAGPRTR